MTIFLAYETMTSTQDLSRSALFLSIHFIVPALFAPGFSKLTRRIPTRRLLTLMEVVNIMLALIVATMTTLGLPMLLIYPVVSLFGLSIMALRSGRLEIVKRAQGRHEQAALNTVAQTAIYLGVAFGAALVPLAVGLSINVIVLIVIFGFGVSFLLNFMLMDTSDPKDEPVREHRLSAMAAAFRSDWELEINFLLVVLSMTVLQGFMQIARVAIPVDTLGGGAELVSLFQTVMIAAFVTAAQLVRLFPNKRGFSFDALSLILLSMLMGSLAGFIDNATGAMILVFLFILFFEIAFLLALNRLVASAASSQVFAVTLGYQVFGGLGIVSVSLIGSEIYDRYSLVYSVAWFWAVALSFALFCVIRYARRHTGVPQKP